MTDDQIKRIRAKRAKALAAFHPVAGDRLQIILINERGHRSPPGKKGWPVYVGKTGKKSIFGGHLYQVKRTTLKAVFGKQKTAQSKFFALQRRVTAQHTFDLHPLPRENGHIDLLRIARHVSATVRNSWPSKRGATRSIRFSFAFDETDVDPLLPLVYSERKKPSMANLIKFFYLQIYANMAEYLKGRGYVSIGSAERIQKQNRGKKRARWKDENGELWSKRKCRNVKITRFSYAVTEPRVKKVKGT